MKLAIMQPYFFPYVSYFQLINAVDKFVILDDVNYINKGWINRNRILVNGKDYLFTIPIKCSSQNKLIFECEIADEKWKYRLLKTIEMSYKKAPFFEQSFEIITRIIEHNDINLSNYIHNQIKVLSDYLLIKTEIVKTSNNYCNLHLKAQDKIIDICKKENAKIYINAFGGQKLYTKEIFTQNEIELKFIATYPLNYKQFNNDYIIYLSIIDMMMFNSQQSIINFLTQYDLVSNE